MNSAAKLEKWKTALIEANVPEFFATENMNDTEKMVTAKFFMPSSGATWYVLEWDKKDTIFCYVTGMQEDEYGYVNLPELSRVKRKNIFEVELDEYFTSIPMSQILNE